MLNEQMMKVISHQLTWLIEGTMVDLGFLTGSITGIKGSSGKQAGSNSNPNRVAANLCLKTQESRSAVFNLYYSSIIISASPLTMGLLFLPTG